MQSLRDKLLQAGLVSEEQAKKSQSAPAARPPRAPERSAPRGTRPPPATELEKRIPALPPMPGSKAHQRLEALKQQELDRQLRQCVVEAQLEPALGTHAFHFVTRKGKLRRLDLSPEQAQQLESGALAVVERQDPDKIEHALVPAATAEKLLGLSEKAVRFYNRPGAPIGFTPEEPDATPPTD